jgi:hypothetical protein
VEFRNSRQSPEIPETPDKTSKLRKGSRVDGKARGSREGWKWIGSPLTVTIPSVRGTSFRQKDWWI